MEWDAASAESPRREGMDKWPVDNLWISKIHAEPSTCPPSSGGHHSKTRTDRPTHLQVPVSAGLSRLSSRLRLSSPIARPSAKTRVRRGVNKSVRLEAAPDGDLLARERGKCRGMPLRGMTRPNRPTLTRRFAPLALGLIALGGDACLAADLHWRRLGNETAEVLADVIRIDTQNPPGGETAAANALARKLEAEGIRAEVFESSPGRGN